MSYNALAPIFECVQTSWWLEAAGHGWRLALAGWSSPSTSQPTERADYLGTIQY